MECRCAFTNMQIRICRRADAGMCTCSRRDAPHTSRQLRKGGCRDTKTRHRLAPSPHYSTDVNGRQAVPMPRHLRPHRIFAALLRKFHGVTAEFSLRPYGITEFLPRPGRESRWLAGHGLSIGTPQPGPCFALDAPTMAGMPANGSSIIIIQNKEGKACAFPSFFL